MLGIIGKPVAHSLSPVMHNAAFDALGMDWVYVPFPVEPDRLETAVKGLAMLGIRGVNVTVPHKEKVIPALNTLSPQASVIGAVNTISVRDGSLVGDNTDWAGFLDDLAEQGFDPSGSRAVILGAGGSSRAVVYGLAVRGAEVVVASRNPEAARAMVEGFRRTFPDNSLAGTSMDKLHALDFLPDLIVNTTPVGMSPHGGLSPWPQSIAFPECKLAYDLIYAPPVTRFMEQASETGVRNACGVGMLIHQAARSFKIWTGKEAPLHVMKRAAEAASIGRRFASGPDTKSLSKK